jgi:hypothetical protein
MVMRSNPGQVDFFFFCYLSDAAPKSLFFIARGITVTEVVLFGRSVIHHFRTLIVGTSVAATLQVRASAMLDCRKLTLRSRGLFE